MSACSPMPKRMERCTGSPAFGAGVSGSPLRAREAEARARFHVKHCGGRMLPKSACSPVPNRVEKRTGPAALGAVARGSPTEHPGDGSTRPVSREARRPRAGGLP